MKIMTINFEGEFIKRDKEGRFSLNDLHKKAGADATRDPRRWIFLDTTKALIEVLQEQQNLTVRKSDSLEVLQAKVGRTGGTFAILPLALAYAKYLSPEFHAACRKVLVEHRDFEKFVKIVEYPKVGKPVKDFALSQDLAANIAMMSGSRFGMEAV